LVDYYNQLAGRYDDERFANSYGAYIHAQERRLLQCWLAPITHGKILDLACGTGRLRWSKFLKSFDERFCRS